MGFSGAVGGASVHCGVGRGWGEWWESIGGHIELKEDNPLSA